MLLGLIVWILSIFILSFLIFCVVFVLISASDLESDAINPIDMCKRTNVLVWPEIASHAVMTAMFLLSLNIFEFIINLPLLGYHAYLVSKQQHTIDEITIYQGDRLYRIRKNGMIKLAFLLFCFFLYLYRLVSYAISMTSQPQTSSY